MIAGCSESRRRMEESALKIGTCCEEAFGCMLSDDGLCWTAQMPHGYRWFKAHPMHIPLASFECTPLALVSNAHPSR